MEGTFTAAGSHLGETGFLRHWREPHVAVYVWLGREHPQPCLSLEDRLADLDLFEDGHTFASKLAGIVDADVDLPRARGGAKEVRVRGCGAKERGRGGKEWKEGRS